MQKGKSETSGGLGTEVKNRASGLSQGWGQVSWDGVDCGGLEDLLRVGSSRAAGGDHMISCGNQVDHDVRQEREPSGTMRNYWAFHVLPGAPHLPYVGGGSEGRA